MTAPRALREAARSSSAARRRRRIVVLVIIAAVGWPGAAPAVCTPSPLPPDTPLAVVLSGGGAKGAYEAGVAATFLRRALPIRLAAGSSAGALNAAMLADGRAERLEARWRSLTREQVYTLRTSVFFAGLLPGWLTLLTLDAAGSLFDPQPLRELIAASLDLPRIRASPVRLLVVATDLARRQRRIFDNQT